MSPSYPVPSQIPTQTHGQKGATDPCGHSHFIPHNPQSQISSSAARKLKVAFLIVLSFMLVEIIGGWLANSLALISDGLHMLSDAVALGLASWASTISSRKADIRKTFGYQRMEVLAAFSNGLLLAGLSMVIIFQAMSRLLNPQPVQAEMVLWIASVGLAVNLFMFWWLHRGGEERSLNVSAALWHVMGDVLGSVAAIAAAVGILLTGWMPLDPLLSLMIAGIISYGAFKILRESGHILVEGTPAGVDIYQIRACILDAEQVQEVNDLHVWSMNGRDLYISAHIRVKEGQHSPQFIVEKVTQLLTERFHSGHVTLQVDDRENCLAHCEIDWVKASNSKTR